MGLIELYNMGLSGREVGTRLGISKSAIHRKLTRASRAGHVVYPRKSENYFYEKMKQCGVSRGSIKDVVRDTDEAFENWLANRVIEMQCESISEYIRETLLEKYYNEMHQDG